MTLQATRENTIKQLEDLIRLLDKRIKETGSASLKSTRATAQAELDYWRRK